MVDTLGRQVDVHPVTFNAEGGGGLVVPARLKLEVVLVMVVAIWQTV
jgi:hypothetical protein